MRNREHHSSVLLAGSVALAVLGCGDDVSGPSMGELEQLCGEDRALRLLELDQDRTLIRSDLRVVGDRYLVSLEFAAGPGELWSVGRCGESPSLLASDLERDVPVLWFERWPDVPLVCRAQTHELLAVDPSGVLPSNPVFGPDSCFGEETAAGLVAVSEQGETRAVTLQPWPDVPLEQSAVVELLVEDLAEGPTPPLDTAATVFAQAGGEVLAVTADAELVAVDVQTRVQTSLATGVRHFAASRTGAWLLWQGVEELGGEPPDVEGSIHLLERELAASEQIGQGALERVPRTAAFELESLGIAYFRGSGSEDGVVYEDVYVDLATREIVELPLGAPLISPLKAISATTALFWYPFVVFDVETGESRTLYSGDLDLARLDDDGMTVLGQDGRLEWYAYTGESELLAERAARHWRRAADGRVATLLSVDQAGHGTLAVVDPADQTEAVIDTDVVQRSISLVEDEGLLVSYAITGSERAGIWIAALP